MESVLHIELLNRRISPPAFIGFRDFISYGETVVDEENAETDPTICSVVGSPLTVHPPERLSAHIPLVKTFEYMPDLTRSRGDVFSETLYYFEDKKYLIPIRTKIHSGRSQGLRVSHLRSLNHVRKRVSGMTERAFDFRPEVVSQLLEKDDYFVNNQNTPAVDWVQNGLMRALTTSTITDTRFSAESISSTIDRFVKQVKASRSADFGVRDIKEIVNSIALAGQTVPAWYRGDDVLVKHIRQVRDHLVPHHSDLKSFGRLPIENIPNLEHNPMDFQSVMGLLDRIPLTDINIELIVDTDNNVRFYKEHYVANRMAYFHANELGAFSTDTLIADLLSPDALRNILKQFYDYHRCMDEDTVREVLRMEPVKLRIVKTIEDEALILLYRHDSTEHDEPLCGVYFDIALQSLAPLSLVPEINPL